MQWSTVPCRQKRLNHIYRYPSIPLVGEILRKKSVCTHIKPWRHTVYLLQSIRFITTCLLQEVDHAKRCDRPLFLYGKFPKWCAFIIGAFQKINEIDCPSRRFQNYNRAVSAEAELICPAAETICFLVFRAMVNIRFKPFCLFQCCFIIHHKNTHSLCKLLKHAGRNRSILLFSPLWVIMFQSEELAHCYIRKNSARV